MRSSLAPVQFWWTSRSPREQVLLLILMAAIAVWLAVVAVWQPLLASRQHLIEMVARHERARAVLQT